MKTPKKTHTSNNNDDIIIINFSLRLYWDNPANKISDAEFIY